MKQPTLATNQKTWYSHSGQPSSAPGGVRWVVATEEQRHDQSNSCVIIAMYSAMKNMENFIDEYSVW